MRKSSALMEKSESNLLDERTPELEQALTKEQLKKQAKERGGTGNEDRSK